jgi:hypothetical protein
MSQDDLEWLTVRVRDPTESLASIEQLVDNRLALRTPNEQGT